MAAQGLKRRKRGEAARPLPRRREVDAPKRTQLTIGEKKLVIRHKMANMELTFDEMASWVEKEMGVIVNPSTICKWMAEKEGILAKRDEDSCKLRDGKWPEMEDIIEKWVDEYTAQNGVVTSTLLHERAIEVKKELEDMGMGDLAKDFTGAVGWIRRFCKRYGIMSR